MALLAVVDSICDARGFHDLALGLGMSDPDDVFRTLSSLTRLSVDPWLAM